MIHIIMFGIKPLELVERKTIKKIGNSLGVTFNKEEQYINNLHKDDIVEIIIKKIKR